MHMSIILPRPTQSNMTCIHTHNITLNSILKVANNKNNQALMRDNDCTGFGKPNKLIRARMRSSRQIQLLNTKGRSNIFTFSRINN